MKLLRYKVEWSGAASADLDRLLAFIALDSVQAAFKVLDRIESKAAALSALPLRGRVVPELARYQIRIYRELIITPPPPLSCGGTARLGRWSL